MIHLRASAAFGFGGKQYIARITGRSSKFTFEREFIGRKGGKRNESCDADVDTPGLYECRGWHRKNYPEDSYVLVLETSGDKLEGFSLDKEDAMKIAKALDAGRPIDQIVEVQPDGWSFITPRQAEARQVAQTIDSAVEACWAVLQALPEKDAKKVLAQLKIRVSPPKTALAEDAPVGVVSDAAQDAGADPEQLGLTPTPIVTDPS